MSVPNAPRIERGPMVAEVLERDYTRIGNRLIRDGRLDWKPKSIFIWMASHKNGFGVSPESIAAAGPGGVSAVKSALRELERYGYLTRSQRRTKGGTMGQTIYRITDMPSSEPVDENRSADATSNDIQSGRSEPVDENPPAVQPPAVDRPHKKTIPLQEDQLVEDELSLPLLPAQRSEPNPVHEREILSPFEDPDPQQPEPLPGIDVYTDQLTDTAEATARVAASWAEAYKRISNGSNPSAKATARVRASAASRLRAGKTVDDLMSIAVDMAETNLTWTDLAEHEAHWLNKQHGLTGTGNGTDDRVKGWLALASDLRDDKRNQPYTDNVWDQMRHQLESGARPDGWERVPHCGHVDCDPITRGRESDDGSGTRTVTWCSACHPNLQF